MRYGKVLLGGVALAALATDARAAGFALKEQSATAQGNAFAGATAGAEDPSYMFFNPAALGFQSGWQAQAVVSRVMPRSELRNATGTTLPPISAPIGGPDSDGDVGDDGTLPAVYLTGELPYGWHVGLSVTAPFGLSTSYPDAWVGRYHGTDSALETYNIGPTVAWRPVPWLSLGGGVQIQYADAELQNRIDFGTIGAAATIPGAIPTAQDGRVRVVGDDWAAGLTLGAIAEPLPGTRIGVAYRSEIDHTLSGDADFVLDRAGTGAILSGLTGRFVDTGATAGLTTPESVSFGVRQQLGERWAVMADLQWTGWSSFEELRIDFGNPAEPDNVTEQRWNDVWFAALGATWRPSDAWTLRAGVAYDQSPVTDKHRTPRIPNGDRYWVSLGVGWKPASWLSVDAAYTHIFVEDTEVDLTTGGVGNQFRGNLAADYASAIDIVAISGRVRF